MIFHSVFVVAAGLFSTVAVGSPIEVAEALENSIAARGSNNNVVIISTFADGACSAGSTNTARFGSGNCHNIDKSYAVIMQNQYNDFDCAVKFWEGSDCSDKATVTTIAANENIYSCLPIADKGGSFYLVNGANSISVTCY